MSDVRGELQSIYQRRHILTPPVVVEEARSVESPLHSHFEWDDTVAGEKYRLVQASELIRSVRVTYTSPDGAQKDVRQWLSVSHSEVERSYLPLEQVVDDPFSYRLVLQEMERDMAALQRKYGHLKEFAETVQRLAV